MFILTVNEVLSACQWSYGSIQIFYQCEAENIKLVMDCAEIYD